MLINSPGLALVNGLTVIQSLILAHSTLPERIHLTVYCTHVYVATTLRLTAQGMISVAA